MAEANRLREILLALGSRPDCRVWRNTVGEGWQGDLVRRTADTVTLRNPRYVKFGLAAGSHDVIGIVKQTITAADIGSSWGRFLAVEVKDAGRLRRNQALFHEVLRRFDALQGVAHSPAEAEKILLGNNRG